jgi:hypothetical protein
MYFFLQIKYSCLIIKKKINNNNNEMRFNISPSSSSSHSIEKRISVNEMEAWSNKNEESHQLTISILGFLF